MATLAAAEEPSKTTITNQPRSIRNVLSNWGGYFFSILVGLFLSPFVVHRLGNSAYGVWTLMVSLTGYLGLLDFGVRGSVTRYVARFHARGEHEGSSRLVSTALAIFGCAGILAILISGLIAWRGTHLFRIPAEYQDQARIVFALAGISVLGSLLGGVFGGVLVGLHRFDLTNITEIVTSALRAVATVVALLLGQGIITLACIQVACSLAANRARAVMSLRLYPQLKIGLRLVDKENLRVIYAFSVNSFMLHVFATVILYADAIVIATALPIAFVTFFSIGGNLFTYARGLLSGITQTVTPLASKLDGEGEFGRLQALVLKASCYATTLMLPVYVTFILRGDSVIGLWMGKEYGPLSGQVLAVLALAGIFSAAPAIAWAAMFGISKHGAMVPMYLTEAAVNLGLSVWWVHTFGILGVAWGTTIPNLLVSLLFWPWYLHRTLKISPMKFIVQAWMRPAVAMVPFALMTQVMAVHWPANRLLGLFGQIFLALPVAALPAWFLCARKEDRQHLLKQIGGMRARWKAA